MIISLSTKNGNRDKHNKYKNIDVKFNSVIESGSVLDLVQDGKE